MREAHLRLNRDRSVLCAHRDPARQTCTFARRQQGPAAWDVSVRPLCHFDLLLADGKYMLTTLYSAGTAMYSRVRVSYRTRLWPTLV
jgi:hypothetical protein